MKRWIPFIKSRPVVSVVRLSGIIAAGKRGGLNDETLAPLLENAFTRGKPRAVALLINSPGGSPVQSSLIGARIRRLSEDKNVPVYAFVEDVAASGGYWLASAADEIWIDACSVVGSIGVISSSFGVHDLISRYGVERRVYTAGQSKSMLDPFKPEKDEDVARLKSLLAEIHSTFIGHVTARRGSMLKTDADIFTGEIWTGQRAIELGLVDGIGHLTPVMREKVGDKVKFRTYGPRRSIVQRFGAQAVEQALHSVEERALFARYGL